jgi:hypothetical protein
MPNTYINRPIIGAIVMASIVRCGGRIKKPCTGSPLVYCSRRGRP